MIISTSILHFDSNCRENLLRFLFELIVEPKSFEREILLDSFVIFARQSSSIRVQTEFFPQLWQNLNAESVERRKLVAEATGRLVVVLPKQMKINLILPILRQMFLDDFSDEIRSIACRNLSLIVFDLDDSIEFQFVELLDRCWTDTSKVFQSARDFLLPSIAFRFVDSTKFFSILIERFLVQIETSIQVRRKHLSSLSFVTK